MVHCTAAGGMEQNEPLCYETVHTLQQLHEACRALALQAGAVCDLSSGSVAGDLVVMLTFRRAGD